MQTNVSLHPLLSVASGLSSIASRYSEALPLLYSSNVFCFQDIATLCYFVRTVLPHRLNQITRIQLPWMKTYLGFPYPNSELPCVWEALGQMPKLQEIHIVRLVTRDSFPTWRYHVWTYWIAQLKTKSNVKLIGDQDVAPMQFALRMSLDEAD